MGLAAALLAGTSLTAAKAAPVTFFGEDLSAGAVLGAFPNSDAARIAFFSNLVGVGTETFEGIAAGTGVPVAVSFGAAGTATISGSGTVQAGLEGGGRYPISGTNYFNASTTDFTLSFSDPIAAFGFYGVDIGDYGGAVSLQLTDTAGIVSLLDVGNTVGGSGSTSHSVLYFGFYDLTTQYTAISLINPSTGDIFGFDDFSIGSIEQVVPAPEPMSMALFGLGLAGLGFAARRRKA
jgi:hypothetical protein